MLFILSLNLIFNYGLKRGENRRKIFLSKVAFTATFYSLKSVTIHVEAEKQCITSEEDIMKETNKKKWKKVAVIGALALFIIGACVWAGLPTVPDEAEAKATTDSLKDLATGVQEAKTEIDKAVKEAEEKKKEQAEKEKAEQEASSEEEAVAESPAQTSSSGSSGGSKPSTPEKSSSKPSSDKPSHTHSWSPVYGTKKVQTGTENKWVASVRVCNCGARNVDTAHTKNHMHAGEPSSTWVDEVYEEVPVYENQQYIEYYKCSCGATK